VENSLEKITRSFAVGIGQGGALYLLMARVIEHFTLDLKLPDNIPKTGSACELSKHHGNKLTTPAHRPKCFERNPCSSIR
jgi:hypothetical protein